MAAGPPEKSRYREGAGVIGQRATIALLILALAGAFLSGLLLLQHYNESHAVSLVSMMCGGETASGCSAVNRSAYATFLGIPLAAFGLLFYLSLSLLMALTSVGDPPAKALTARIGFTAAAFAFAADLILLGIQAFALHTFCVLCLVTYAMTLGILGLFFPYRRSGKRETKDAAGQQSGRRIILVSWLAGTVVLGVAVWSINLAMEFQDPATFDARLDAIAYDEYQKSSPQNIDLQGIPFEGPAEAPIRIVLYSDFLCPWCRQIAQTIQQHIRKWEPNVVVYYKMYPLDQLCNPYEKKTEHPGACWAALGGMCAQEQGLFWEYHDRIFNTPPRNPRPQDILNIGVAVGLDTVKMKQGMVSPPLRRNIRAQIEEARSNGVTGTPSIFINGKKVPRIGYFNSVLTMEAKRLGLPPLNATKE